MEITYILKIFTSSINDVSLLLKQQSCADNDLDYWSYEISEMETDDSKYYDIINFYARNINLLIESNLMTHETELLILYQYNQQCNIEFSHEELLELAKLKLNLCISCWEV
jgi:hypothetical protein